MRSCSNTLVIVIDSARYQNPCAVFDSIEDTVKEFGGRKYTEMRAPSIWSLPSHVSFLSGIDACEHGVMRNTDSVHDTVRLLYDELSGVSGVFSTNPFLENDEYGLASQFDYRCHEPKLSTDGVWSHSKEAIDRLFRDRHIVESVRQWVGEHNGDGWNALVNMMDAHTPYIPECIRYSDFQSVICEGNTKYDGDFTVSDEELSVKQLLYCDCLVSVSHRIASLIRYLADTGELQDTHIIITSDHGEGFGESSPVHDRDSVYHYNSMGEELLHVPLFEIHPDIEEFEIVESLGSVTNVYGILTGELESLCCEEATASMVFGGNLFDEKSFFGECGEVLYRECGSGDIEKYVVSGGDAWSTTEASDGVVTGLVEEAVDRDPQEDISTSGSISSVTEDRLSSLGYI